MTLLNNIYTKLAFDSIEEYIKKGNTRKIENKNVPEELKHIRSCFVTLKNKKGKLLGCIGTIKPSYKNLYTEIIKNAISSAFYDSRFYGIKLKDLKNIVISVEILEQPEQIEDLTLLDPSIYGLIISDKISRGVLLPGIKEIDSIEKQIRIVKKKAGIDQDTQTGLKYFRFKTTKYTS